MKKNTRKKALLINPPTGLYIREDRCQVPVKGLSATALRTPIDLAYMAASLRTVGWDCVIRDYPAVGATEDDLKRDLETLQPGMLVVSVTTATFDKDMETLARAKEVLPDLLTIAKGAHLTVLAEEEMKRFPKTDIAIRGEYEFTIAEIAEAEDLSKIAGITYHDDTGELHSTPDRPFIEDLDSIPFPARDLLDNSLYVRPDTGEMQTTVQTNRGCPSRCIYCLSHVVSGSQVRSRSPQNVVAELEECVKRYGIRNFFFRADTFTIQKEWVIELCRLILEKDLKIKWVCNSRVNSIDDERLDWMKRAGCWLVSLGIESGNAEILKRMGKGATLDQARNAVKLCRKHKMKSFCFYLIGLPWDTKETVEETIRFARELSGDFNEVHVSVPFPGTELYQIAENDGLFVHGGEFGDHAHVTTRTYTLSPEELEHYRNKLLRAVYMTPRYILRTLLGVRDPRVLFNYAKYGTHMFWRMVRGG